MEKITKGAVKNGESRRRDVGGMRGESKFFFWWYLLPL